MDRPGIPVHGGAAQRAQRADGSAVASVLTQAETLLSGSNPGAKRPAVRAQLLSLATALDWYNRGITGPGHCSE
jgi:hypothetical protein